MSPTQVAYRPHDVEALSGLPRSTVYHRIKTGQLRARRSGPRQIVILAEDLQDFLRSLPDARR